MTCPSANRLIDEAENDLYLTGLACGTACHDSSQCLAFSWHKDYEHCITCTTNYNMDPDDWVEDGGYQTYTKVSGASVHGDPKAMNMHGDTFDIQRLGTFTLLN